MLDLGELIPFTKTNERRKKQKQLSPLHLLGLLWIVLKHLSPSPSLCGDFRFLTDFVSGNGVCVFTINCLSFVEVVVVKAAP